MDRPQGASSSPTPGRDWRPVAQWGLLLLFLFALAGGIALFLRQSGPRGVEVSLSPPAAGVTVHISGAVATPGVYALSEGDRLQEAVAAAGGFGVDADADAVNLALRLRDGERYHIARLGEQPAPAASPSAPRLGLVNLNTASVQELTSLPGIGPTRAQAILQFRERNGRFQRVEDLLKVTGIGPATLEGLRGRVTMD